MIEQEEFNKISPKTRDILLRQILTLLKKKTATIERLEWASIEQAGSEAWLRDSLVATTHLTDYWPALILRTTYLLTAESLCGKAAGQRRGHEIASVPSTLSR